MIGGSIRERRKLASNLRAAPGWLSPRRVEGILGLLDAMRDRTVPVAVFAPPVAPEAVAIETPPPAPKPRKPRKPRAPRVAPVPQPEIVNEAAPEADAAADRAVGTDAGDRVPDDLPALRPVELSEPAAPALVSGVDRLKSAHAAVLERAPTTPGRPYRRAALEAQQPWIGVSVTKSTSVPAPIRVTVHGTGESKTAIVSWVERQIEQVRAAIAFLRGKGFSVERADEGALIARYWVSGYRGEFSAKQVLAFAATQGFAA